MISRRSKSAEILAYTRAVIEATLRNQPVNGQLPEPLAEAPTYGLFVSLHRATQLRACKGGWGGTEAGGLAALSQLLARIAPDAATNDPRLPRITLAELPYLTVEVSLLHSPEAVTARGAERVRSVQVGTHGLVIMHPRGRGLLLPQVAVEAKWDARTFLEQTCHKAGLPPQTWREDEAKLMTFCARRMTSPPLTAELNPAEVGAGGLSELFGFIHEWLRGQGETPSAAGTAGDPGMPDAARAPLLHRIHPEELGLCLQTASGATGATVGANNSLLNLAKTAAQSLADVFRQRGQSEALQKMIVLWQPLALAAADYPVRDRALVNCAVLAQAAGRWSLVVPPPEGRADTIAEALAALKVTHQQWRDDRTGQIRLTAFSALHCHNQAQGGRAGHPAAGSGANVRTGATPGGLVRRAFRAGMFYPAEAAQVAAEVDGYLRAGGLGQPGSAARAYRAIMLPHAGWRFCGGTMGKTLAGVKVPQTIIVIGPKHTPLGPTWSVANHAAWQIPGATIPVATALAQRLSRAIPLLACEAEAHREEHGTEVLLPFLQRLRPDLRVVPIVLGQCVFETVERAGAGTGGDSARRQGQGGGSAAAGDLQRHEPLCSGGGEPPAGHAGAGGHAERGPAAIVRDVFAARYQHVRHAAGGDGDAGTARGDGGDSSAAGGLYE